MIYSVLILAAASIAGMFTAAYFYDERAHAIADLHFAEQSNLDLQYLNEQLHAAPNIPSPAQDSFLELADLRLEVAEVHRRLESAERAYAGSEEKLVAERRTNAALRGQITKLTPKKGKVK